MENFYFIRQLKRFPCLRPGVYMVAYKGDCTEMSWMYKWSNEEGKSVRVESKERTVASAMILTYQGGMYFTWNSIRTDKKGFFIKKDGRKYRFTQEDLDMLDFLDSLELEDL